MWRNFRWFFPLRLSGSVIRNEGVEMLLKETGYYSMVLLVFHLKLVRETIIYSLMNKSDCKNYKY